MKLCAFRYCKVNLQRGRHIKLHLNGPPPTYMTIFASHSNMDEPATNVVSRVSTPGLGRRCLFAIPQELPVIPLEDHGTPLHHLNQRMPPPPPLPPHPKKKSKRRRTLPTLQSIIFRIETRLKTKFKTTSRWPCDTVISPIVHSFYMWFFA